MWSVGAIAGAAMILADGSGMDRKLTEHWRLKFVTSPDCFLDSFLSSGFEPANAK